MYRTQCLDILDKTVSKTGGTKIRAITHTAEEVQEAVHNPISCSM